MSQEPTARERFAAALDRRPLPGLVPHFELVFYLTMEAFGRVHPLQRSYGQWWQMEESERRLHRLDMARLFIETAERYSHDAIFLHPNPGDADETLRLLELVRELDGDRHFLLLHGDATFGIPSGSGMEDISVRMLEEPEAVDDEARRMVDEALERARRLQISGLLDGFALCSDYCFNTGSFLPPDWFDRFVQPHLKALIANYRGLGFYTIKHTDGNIMPILDRLLDANPHALHSLDPQGGVDMAEMVRLAGDKVALCGNVDCGLMQTGSDEDVLTSARYALHEGMKAPGYVFCTSNCIYTGMPLGRYELILDLWRREGRRG
jgi:uroporphyrinogen decarboxylase